MATKPNDWIYIYYIHKEAPDKIFYDRSMSRTGLGPSEAKRRVKALESRGHEAFYVIGTTIPGAFS